MSKTAQEWMDELNLERLPTKEEVAVFNRAASKSKVKAAYTPTDPQQLRSMLGEAIATQQIQEFLKTAREQAGLGLGKAGAAQGISKGRVQQLEAAENLTLDSLFRALLAYGYKVTLTATPEQGKPISLEVAPE